MEASIPDQIEMFFAGYPEQLQLFWEVKRFIEGFGPVKVEVMKSQISFGTNYKFAWVWLPQKLDMKQPEGSMVLTFGLDRHIEDSRIKQVVNPYPNRSTHHMVINCGAELDDTVVEWLREAYQFSKRPKKESRK